MDFSRTRISTNRPLTSYAKVRVFLGTMLRNRSILTKKSQLKDKEYLDIGCGPNLHPEFINFDYGWRPGLDLCWDVRRGIPLRENSLRGIFTEQG